MSFYYSWLAAIDKDNIYSLLFFILFPTFFILFPTFLLNAHSLKFNGQKLLILKKTLAFSL
jgi:hypothetical protein